MNPNGGDRRILLVLAAAFFLSWPSHAKAQAPGTLTLDAPQTMGISMFRPHWDTPIPLAEDGITASPEAMTNKTHGAYALWSADKRNGRPGAIAFDALNRSLLVRFPDAAEKIAGRLKAGGRISKVELLLPFKDEEAFPPGGPDFHGSDGYEYRANWGVAELYAQERPTWHAVAWALRKPWTADERIGPTFNAAINGALYWKKYGAQDEAEDRVATRFGPTEVSYQKSEAMDVTATLRDPAFGRTVGDRLRALADCGFLINKWETYDHRYYRGVYEWATATGGRGILIHTPKLVVTFAPGHAVPLTVPPAVDIPRLISDVEGTLPGGVPTAVIPPVQAIQHLAEIAARKPAWMDDTQWKHLRELMAIQNERTDEREPLWVFFVPPYLLAKFRGASVANGEYISVHYAKPQDVYTTWVDKLLRRQPRGWNGFETANEFTEWAAAKDTLPGPALDAFQRYWTGWLMADRPTAPTSHLLDLQLLDGSLIHPMADQLVVGSNTSAVIPRDTYWKKTGDWRGNKSFFRSGFCYAQSTQNFNTTSSTGAFIFGGIFGADRALNDGKHGVTDWLLNGWIGNDGSSQEHYDHYYYPITLKGLKALQNSANDPTSALIGDALVTKAVAEALLAWHPNLRRFIAPSSRTSLNYLLGTEDGGQYLMHALSKKGALTDLGVKTLPGNYRVFADETSPTLIALMTLCRPWVPADMASLADDKPLPWDVIHRNGNQWRRTHLGTNYGLASSMTQGGRIQAMAQWRREAKEVTGAQDLGTLDMRMGVNETNWINNAPGYIWQPGSQIVAQNKNAWLAVGSPQNFNGGFGDGKTPITSIQCSIGFFDLHALEAGHVMPWEIYVGGRKVEHLPVSAKQGQPIFIRDGVTYLCILPLPSPDLGRNAEVTLEDGNLQKYNTGNEELAFRAGLVINSYIVRKTTPLDNTADWWGMRRAYAGFALQFGDATEYSSFDDFRGKMTNASVNTRFDSTTNTVTANYKNGAQDLEVRAITAPAMNPDGTWKSDFFTALLAATLNGAPLYSDDSLLLDSPVEQYRWNKAEKNGATLATAGRTGKDARLYLQSSTDKRRFVGWNLQGGPVDFQFTLPGGLKLRSDGSVGLTRVAVDLDEKTLDVRHALLDAGKLDAVNKATALLLAGFEGYKVTINGRMIGLQLQAAQVGDSFWQVLPLFTDVPPRTEEAMAQILQNLEAILSRSKNADPR